MLNLQFNFIQLLGLVIFTVFTCYLVKELFKFVIQLIFSNKKVVAWNLKRQAEQKKAVQKSQLQKMGEDIAMLEQFIDWVEKQIPHNQHKQFWKDFSDSKETRTYWIKTLRDLIALKEKQLDQPIVANKSKENNNAPQGTMQTSTPDSQK
jgi:hypothetical protein